MGQYQYINQINNFPIVEELRLYCIYSESTRNTEKTNFGSIE